LRCLAHPGWDVKEKTKKETLCNNWRGHTGAVVHTYCQEQAILCNNWSNVENK